MRWAPILEFRQKRRRPAGPFKICVVKLLPQELFLGEHNTFVVQPEQKDVQDDKPPKAKDHERTEKHKEIPKIKRMPHKGIDPARIEGLSYLALYGITAGCSFRGVPCYMDADRQSRDGNAQTQHFQNPIEGVAIPRI